MTNRTCPLGEDCEEARDQFRTRIEQLEMQLELARIDADQQRSRAEAADRIEALEAALLAADELAEMVRRSATHHKDGQPYCPSNPKLYAALAAYRTSRATGDDT